MRQNPMFNKISCTNENTMVLYAIQIKKGENPHLSKEIRLWMPDRTNTPEMLCSLKAPNAAESWGLLHPPTQTASSSGWKATSTHPVV